MVFKSNPGLCDRMMIGMATSVMRLTDVIRGGTVLPSAWNMLEDTNTTPEVTKLHAAMCRYSTPMRTTSGSLVKIRMNRSASK